MPALLPPLVDLPVPLLLSLLLSSPCCVPVLNSWGTAHAVPPLPLPADAGSPLLVLSCQQRAEPGRAACEQGSGYRTCPRAPARRCPCGARLLPLAGAGVRRNILCPVTSAVEMSHSYACQAVDQEGRGLCGLSGVQCSLRCCLCRSNLFSLICCLCARSVNKLQNPDPGASRPAASPRSAQLCVPSCLFGNGIFLPGATLFACAVMPEPFTRMLFALQGATHGSGERELGCSSLRCLHRAARQPATCEGFPLAPLPSGSRPRPHSPSFWG